MKKKEGKWFFFWKSTGKSTENITGKKSGEKTL
jgi:hypothetical protein